MLANLTGALLARVAPALLDTLNPGGTLDRQRNPRGGRGRSAPGVSGCDVVWRQQEDEWVGLMLQSARA